MATFPITIGEAAARVMREQGHNPGPNTWVYPLDGSNPVRFEDWEDHRIIVEDEGWMTEEDHGVFGEGTVEVKEPGLFRRGLNVLLHLLFFTSRVFCYVGRHDWARTDRVSIPERKCSRCSKLQLLVGDDWVAYGYPGNPPTP